MAFHLKLSVHTDAVVLIAEQWLIEEGEYVDAGRPLLMVRADREPVVVSSEIDGILLGKNVQNGQQFSADDNLATIVTREEAGEIRIEKKLSRRDMEILRSLSLKKRRKIKQVEHVKATPAARKLAHEYGISLLGIHGTGPEGRIQREDVWKNLSNASGEYGRGNRENPKIDRLDLTIGELQGDTGAAIIEAEPAVRIIKGTPLARRIASQYGVEIEQIPGTGSGGKVTRGDVLAFLGLKDPEITRKAAVQTDAANPVVEEVQPVLETSVDEPSESELEDEIADIEEPDQEVPVCESSDTETIKEEPVEEAVLTEEEKPAEELPAEEIIQTAEEIPAEETIRAAEENPVEATARNDEEKTVEEAIPVEKNVGEKQQEDITVPEIPDSDIIREPAKVLAEKVRPELLKEPEQQVIHLPGTGPVIELGTEEPETEKPEPEESGIKAAETKQPEEPETEDNESIGEDSRQAGIEKFEMSGRTSEHTRTSFVTAEAELGSIVSLISQMQGKKDPNAPEIVDFAVLAAIRSLKSIFARHTGSFKIVQFRDGGQKTCDLENTWNLETLSDVTGARNRAFKASETDNPAASDSDYSLVITDCSESTLLSCAGLVPTDAPLVLNLGGKQSRSRFSKAQIRQCTTVRLLLELDPDRISPSRGITILEKICFCLDNPETILLGTEVSNGK